MAEITAITPQKKDKARCNIEVDGRFYCGMKLETVIENRLKVGMVVDPELLSRMQLESEKRTALDRALTHITATMKTEKEIRLYLTRHGYLEDVVEYVVDKMKEYGFIDDAQYALRYAESAGKRKGARVIAAELKSRGISDGDIETALASLGDMGDTARAMLEKYLRGKELTRDTMRKAYQHLIYKGFDHDTAVAALKSLGADDED